MVRGQLEVPAVGEHLAEHGPDLGLGRGEAERVAAECCDGAGVVGPQLGLLHPPQIVVVLQLHQPRVHILITTGCPITSRTCTVYIFNMTRSRGSPIKA